MERYFREVLPALIQKDPSLVFRVFASIFEGGLDSLRSVLENPDHPEETGVSWENPCLELHYPAGWSWPSGGPLFLESDDIRADYVLLMMENLLYRMAGIQESREAPDAVTYSPEVSESLQTVIATPFVLHALNDLVAVRFRGGKEVDFLVRNPKLREALDAMTAEGQAELLEDLHKPKVIGGMVVPDRLETEEPEPWNTVPDWLEEVERRSVNSFTLEAGGVKYEGTVVVLFSPLVADEDANEAYFPIVIDLRLFPAAWDGVVPIPPDVDPSTWTDQERENLWKALQKVPEKLLESLPRKTTGPEVQEAPTFVAVGTPSPERLAAVRSVMSPYPVPRKLAKDAQSTALHRGLGRMFGSASKVPDLDRLGDIAVHEAEALFWSALEDFLDEDLPRRTPPASWRRENLPDGRTSIVLLGLQEDEARRLWTAAVHRMTKEGGGKGLKVADPAFKKENFLDHRTGQVVVQTRLMLWPEDRLVTKEGDRLPPIHFRVDTSPGYLDLLDRQGPRTFFADGWLWVPRGDEREGFRIAGLPSLLFPEGRKALERIAKKEKGELEEHLNRIIRNPSLFQDEDTRAVRELRSAIAKTEAWLRELSVYDSRDLVLCIFEAWYRQRDAWYRETVVLENGKEVQTRPYRIIRLDPEDLRLRLDPRSASGANWRKRLFKKLEALTTFERQTRTREGRKVDVGDRLLERVLDGFTGVDEERTPDYDPGLGLTRLLREAGGIPSRSFYAVVSVDFMQRLVTWAVDETGAVRWGLDAARATERAALMANPESPREARKAGAEKRGEVKKKSFFDGSPRLMSLYNLEDWSQEVKDLALVLLQEVTHKRGRITRNRKALVACKGSSGRGYKVKTWVQKWGAHLLRTGPGGGVKAFTGFLKALRFLSSHETLSVQVELRPSRGRGEKPSKETKWNEDAFKVLESYQAKPTPEVYDLKLVPYLPVDLENRLRKRLRKDGIEAVDEDEATPSILTPSTPGGLAPADIRVARKRAGWDQKKLASMLGVSSMALSFWETAKKPIPKDREARLREVLGPYLEDHSGGSGL